MTPAAIVNLLKHALWQSGIRPYLMKSNQKKDKKKKEDIYVLLFDESLIQQLKKKTAGQANC
jgi:ssRNA-specific RNase YbeY (16S rRNA maturation enzyme)